jgi:hypothetical protein
MITTSTRLHDNLCRIRHSRDPLRISCREEHHLKSVKTGIPVPADAEKDPGKGHVTMIAGGAIRSNLFVQKN